MEISDGPLDEQDRAIIEALNRDHPPRELTGQQAETVAGIFDDIVASVAEQNRTPCPSTELDAA